MKITHVMKDGSTRDTIDGLIIKPESTPGLYSKIKTIKIRILSQKKEGVKKK